MKILDFVFDFGGSLSRERGLCRIRTYIENNNLVTFVTELDKNDGQSITNAIELIIEKLIIKKGFGEHTFIEHYEKDGTLDTFDEVIIKNKQAIWNNLAQNEIKKLIGDVNFSDLINDKSFKNKRIQDQADEIRFRRNPWIGSPNIPSDDFISRKLSIEKKMKPKNNLLDLIDKNSKEQDFLNFFKEDLSFLGEVYAELEDEYIVFAEYPIEKGSKDRDGSIDFVVFTGRSRMSVILIEIKGADFDLFTQTGYRQPNSAISKAAQQIRDRLDVGYYRNMDEFKKQCHLFRKDAEQGKSCFKHVLVGAEQKLLVDSNKDINVRTVIIGGRTRDDYVESRERHKFERSHIIPISLDSWDTWVKKLKR